MAGRGRDATVPAWMSQSSGVVPGTSSSNSGAAREEPLPSRSYELPPPASASYPPRTAGGAVNFSAAGFAPGDPRALIQAAMLNASVGTASSDILRRARRLYVGGVPAGTPDLELGRFFNDTISRVWQPGAHVASTQGRPGFVFVELRDLSGARVSGGEGGLRR